MVTDVEQIWRLRNVMRIAPAGYLSLPLRAHEFLRGVPLHDVSIVDLPGGGEGRSIADVRALASSAEPSRIVTILFGTEQRDGARFHL